MIAIDISMPDSCGLCPFLADFVESMDDVATYCQLEYISHEEAVQQIYADYASLKRYDFKNFPDKRPEKCRLKTLAELTPQDLQRPGRTLVQHYKRRMMEDAFPGKRVGNEWEPVTWGDAH